MVKRLERALTSVAAVALGVYAAVVLVFSLPAMQSRLAGWTAAVLSEKVGARVEIGSVSIGFLNHVIVDDLVVYEPGGKRLATVARVSAGVNVFRLLSGDVIINSAQLFGVNAALYRATPDAAPNFQFLIDAFSSGAKEEPSALDLSVTSLIMRRTNVSYDVLSEPFAEGAFDANHLRLQGCGMNLVLRFVEGESVAVKVRRLQAHEANSGLRVLNTNVDFSATRERLFVSALHVEMPRSSVDFTPFHVNHSEFRERGRFHISKTRVEARLAASDFGGIWSFGSFGSSGNSDLAGGLWVELAATVGGDQDEVSVSDITIALAGIAECAASARVVAPLGERSVVRVDIDRLAVDMGAVGDLVDGDSVLRRGLAAVGSLEYKGGVVLTKTEPKAEAGTDGGAVFSIESEGRLTSGAGDVGYRLGIDEGRQMVCDVTGDSVRLGALLGNEALGKASFALNGTADLTDCLTKPNTKTENKAKTNTKTKTVAEWLPPMRLSGDIRCLDFNGYRYGDIKLAVANDGGGVLKGNVAVDDENLALAAEFGYTDAAEKALDATVRVDRLVPHNLNLAKLPGETFSFIAEAHLAGKDIDRLTGGAGISKLTVATPAERFAIDRFVVTLSHTDGLSSYIIDSDFLEASIEGDVRLSEVVPSFSNIVARHLPQLVRHAECRRDVSFDYSLTMRDCALLRHFAGTDYSIAKPIVAHGHVDDDYADLQLNAPAVSYAGTDYHNVRLLCSVSADLLHTELKANSLKSDGDGTPERMDVCLATETRGGKTYSTIDLSLIDENTMHLHLLPTITLADSLGKLKTDVTLRQSSMAINDTLWTIMPATISVHEKNIACRGLRCVSSAGSELAIDGAVSANQQDSLVAQLSDVEIKYILEAVGFDAVRFAGKASGRATLRGLMSDDKSLGLNARLHVKNFTLQEGSMGDADITARWNRANESIDLTADFIDHFRVPVDLSSTTEEVTGRTRLTGWISPARNDMRLDIMTDHTNAAFIHGFLGGVFTEVSGTLSGPVSVVGLSPVNLVGRAAADISFRLRATDVPYRIPGDTVVLDTDIMSLTGASLLDKYGNRGTISAAIRHHNLKNFSYSVHGDMDGLCAYEETEFNADKFCATLFARGTIDINGADGHPLYINADVTPTRGSVFAYDAATPDAIIGNSFVEFRDREDFVRELSEGNRSYRELTDVTSNSQDGVSDVQNIRPLTPINSPLTPANSPKSTPDYRNDIFFNANIHLTPDCEVKLRMDNIDDGYMRTYGHADFNAQWHNKGSFQLFGNYGIEGGSYRLYLQNLIFRDLALQPGSSVEFNGNPFDAAIHLVCHHTINSVPLSDLTSTKAFSQNNKARVNCILDITGYLEKMDFKFDMELPNVNDEVRQLVRSMINSDEEMNTQMIYLLGVGRFYPSEYARAEGNNNSNQAVNSLLSSTLSGQLNQILSNMIGQNSNWSLGSSLTTGENGWEDLDVEGVLSGRLLNERLLVNGNFGYRDNALTNQASFIGDFEVKYKLSDKGNVYVKAYNQANDRYFTKATLNTQGLGLSWQLDFDRLFPRRRSPLLSPAITRNKEE